MKAVASDAVSQVAATQVSSTSHKGDTPRRKKSVCKKGTINTVVLDHHIFSKDEWKRARFRDHHRVNVTISAGMSTTHRPRTTPDANIRARVNVVADTGAQSDLWSLAEYLACGFSRNSLFRVKLGMSEAKRSPIPIEGAFFAKISTRTGSGGKVITCRSMVYVSNAVQSTYLSYDSMLDLGLLAVDFPGSGAVAPVDGADKRSVGASDPGFGDYDVPLTSSTSASRVIHGGCDPADADKDSSCSCPPAHHCATSTAVSPLRMHS